MKIISMLEASNDGSSSGLSDVATVFNNDANFSLMSFELFEEEEDMISASCGP